MALNRKNEPQSHREHREKHRTKQQKKTQPASSSVSFSVFSVTLWFVFAEESRMPKADPIKDLAEKLLHALEKQRQSGDYPLTVEHLAVLADPQAPPEQVSKALNKKPFAAKWIVANKKDRNSPLTLAEDAERLAAGPQLLEYALSLLCSADKPLHTPAKVISAVDKALRTAFKAALERAIAENNVPATVGIVWVKKKPQLYLQRFPPPPPPPPKQKPAEELSEKLVQVLSEQRERGGEAYPLPLDRLFELTGTTATAKVRKQALGKEPFHSRVLLALPKQPDSPVALIDDRDRLLTSPLLLHGVFAMTRTPDNQAVNVTELARKLPKNLQGDFRAALNRQVNERVLPEDIGLLYSKKKPLLFLLADLHAPPPPKSPLSPPVREVESEERQDKPSPPPVDFSARFEEAFARLDHEHGGHNHVSLVDLRRAVPVERAIFDAVLQQMRRAGRYSLSAAEGRHGLHAEEQEAGIHEDGSLLLFVSRRE
jgi:nucleotide-binding universal stress UspA family protein